MFFQRVFEEDRKITIRKGDNLNQAPITLPEALL